KNLSTRISRLMLKTPQPGAARSIALLSGTLWCSGEPPAAPDAATAAWSVDRDRPRTPVKIDRPGRRDLLPSDKGRPRPAGGQGIAALPTRRGHGPVTHAHSQRQGRGPDLREPGLAHQAHQPLVRHEPLDRGREVEVRARTIMGDHGRRDRHDPLAVD